MEVKEENNAKNSLETSPKAEQLSYKPTYFLRPKNNVKMGTKIKLTKSGVHPKKCREEREG